MKDIRKILILGLIIRLIVILIFLPLNNFDLISYRNVGVATLEGVNIYPFPAIIYHPYIPLMLYLEAGAAILISYQTLILKILFALFDTGIIYVLFILSSKAKSPNLRSKRMSDDPEQSRRRGVLLPVNLDSSALLYALNPVSILITCVQGQFDSIPLFFLLLSLYFFQVKKNTTSMIIASLSVSFKTWPLFFFPPFIRRMKNKSLALIITVLPIFFILLYSTLYHTSLSSIIRTILWYRPVWGSWGVSLVYELLGGPESLLIINRVTLMFTFSFIAVALFLNRKNILEEILLLMLLFFIFTPVFGIQWLMWIVPFLLLTKIKGRNLFICMATIFIAVSYAHWTGFGNQYMINMVGILTWISLGRVVYSMIPISSIVKSPSSLKDIP